MTCYKGVPSYVELLVWSCLCIRKYVLDLAIAKLCTVHSKLYLFCINHVLGFRPRPLIYHSMSGLWSIQHVWSSCFTYNDSLDMCTKTNHVGHGYVMTHNKMCNYLSMPQLNNFGTHIPVTLQTKYTILLAWRLISLYLLLLQARVRFLSMVEQGRSQWEKMLHICNTYMQNFLSLAKTLCPAIYRNGSSTGNRPTDHISIEFEIRPKFAVLLFKMYSTNHNGIFHT